jgi:hypothetical protein
MITILLADDDPHIRSIVIEYGRLRIGSLSRLRMAWRLCSSWKKTRFPGGAGCYDAAS